MTLPFQNNTASVPNDLCRVDKQEGDIKQYCGYDGEIIAHISSGLSFASVATNTDLWAVV